MALPKGKISKARKHSRRANWKLTVPGIVECIVKLKADVASHEHSVKPFAVLRLEHEMLHLFVSPEVPGIVVDREIKRVRIIALYLSPYIESGCEVIEQITLDGYLLPV